MKKYFNLLVCMVLLVSAYSCKDDDGGDNSQAKFAEETRKIQEYLKANNITPTKVPAGKDTVYVYDNDATGSRPVDKDYVLIKFSMYDLNNKLLSTTEPGLAKDGNNVFYYSAGGPIYFRAMPKTILDPLGAAILQMSVGSTAKCIIPSRIFSEDYVPKLYHLSLLKVIKDVKVYEKGMIQRYITKNESSFQKYVRLDTLIDKSRDSVSIGITKMGTGTKIQVGSKVSLNYSLYLLDEVNDNLRLVETTEKEGGEPFVFMYQLGLKLIVGFDMALAELRAGDEATIVIPYSLAYGVDDTAPVKTDNGYACPIPGYSTLVYKVKVESVR